MRNWLCWIITVIILICILAACESPRQKSQELAEQILNQLLQPEDTKLIHTSEFENLSKTGMGTFFGVMGLYGSDNDYDSLFDEYAILLEAQGWRTLGFGGYMRFCNPDHADVEISLEKVAGSEENFKELLGGVEPVTLTEYETLYIVRVSHFPFNTQTCGIAE